MKTEQIRIPTWKKTQESHLRPKEYFLSRPSLTYWKKESPIMRTTDLEHLPELGYTDEEVELEVRKMAPAEHACFEELKRHYELQYRMQGNIKPLREVMQEALEERYPRLPGSQSDRVRPGKRKVA